MLRSRFSMRTFTFTLPGWIHLVCLEKLESVAQSVFQQRKSAMHQTDRSWTTSKTTCCDWGQKRNWVHALHKLVTCRWDDKEAMLVGYCPAIPKQSNRCTRWIGHLSVGKPNLTWIDAVECRIGVHPQASSRVAASSKANDEIKQIWSNLIKFI